MNERTYDSAKQNRSTPLRQPDRLPPLLQERQACSAQSFFSVPRPTQNEKPTPFGVGFLKLLRYRAMFLPRMTEIPVWICCTSQSPVCGLVTAILKCNCHRQLLIMKRFVLILKGSLGRARFASSADPGIVSAPVYKSAPCEIALWFFLAKKEQPPTPR